MKAENVVPEDTDDWRKSIAYISSVKTEQTAMQKVWTNHYQGPGTLREATSSAVTAHLFCQSNTSYTTNLPLQQPVLHRWSLTILLRLYLSLGISNPSTYNDIPRDKHYDEKYLSISQPKVRQLLLYTFQDLPLEMMVRIFSFLSIPDIVWLSLSCKYLSACLNSLLQRYEVRIPHLLSRPRVERHLLLRLQDDRWRFCWWCCLLHPYSKQRVLRSMLGLCEKPCCPARDVRGTTIKDP